MKLAFKDGNSGLGAVGASATAVDALCVGKVGNAPVDTGAGRGTDDEVLFVESRGCIWGKEEVVTMDHCGNPLLETVGKAGKLDILGKDATGT